MNAHAALIRDIPDFPKPGVVFKDITPLLSDAAALRDVIGALADTVRDARVDVIAAIESRGFIFGAALATALGAGFVPIRKPGKLPAHTVGVDYALEYGKDRLEIHADAFAPGARVVLIDDVLATGGTLLAARDLIKAVGGELVAATVVIELAFLDGRRRWGDGAPLHALWRY